MEALADIASLLADWAREPRIMIDVICLLPIVVPTFNLQQRLQLALQRSQECGILTWPFLRPFGVFLYESCDPSQI